LRPGGVRREGGPNGDRQHHAEGPALARIVDHEASPDCPFLDCGDSLSLPFVRFLFGLLLECGAESRFLCAGQLTVRAVTSAGQEVGGSLSWAGGAPIVFHHRSSFALWTVGESRHAELPETYTPAPARLPLARHCLHSLPVFLLRPEAAWPVLGQVP